MTQEALKLALEAMELCNGAETVDGVVIYTDKEIAAIKEALAQPEQEPVAWMRQDGQKVTTASDRHNYPDYETRYSIPLYTTPPQRTWQGLTDQDWKEIEDMPDTFDQGVAWAQAKLKEKNT